MKEIEIRFLARFDDEFDLLTLWDDINQSSSQWVRIFNPSYRDLNKEETDKVVMTARETGHSKEICGMHHIQVKILELAKQEDIGLLTLRAIGEKVGDSQPQKIKHHLEQLKKKGLLTVK
jgi:hypothetical protein